MKKMDYLNTKEWILSITGIIALVLLIVLPPVFRVAFKEKKEKEEIVDEIDIKTLTCTKNNYYSENTANNDTITITYYKDKVRTYNITQEKKYSTIEEYDTAKQNAGLLSTAYELVEEIDYSVTPVDADLKLTIIEKCNLGAFKSTTVKLPGSEEEFKINAVYDTKDSVKEVKGDLEDEGYNCK